MLRSVTLLASNHLTVTRLRQRGACRNGVEWVTGIWARHGSVRGVFLSSAKISNVPTNSALRLGDQNLEIFRALNRVNFFFFRTRVSLVPGSSRSDGEATNEKANACSRQRGRDGTRQVRNLEPRA